MMLFTFAIRHVCFMLFDIIGTKIPVLSQL